MGRTEKRIFLGILALLALVSALYFYQSFASERQVEVYGVSVILCGAGENFEKGLNGAALESNADLHIVRVYDPSADMQTAALERELKNGANAVILYRADAEGLRAWLEKNSTQTPLVFVGNEAFSQKGVSSVSLNAAAQAASLVAEMQKQPNRSVYLAEKGGGSECAEALSTALTAAGFSFDLVDADGIGALLSGRVYAAASPAAAQALLSVWNEGALLYGMGYDGALKSPLENGRIEALALASEFDAGYLAAAEAVSRIDGGRAKSASLEAFLAHSGNMYEAPISTILFPIG